MTVVPFPPKDEEPGAGLAGTIAEARAALAQAADAPSMRREPYRMVLVGLAASLDAMEEFIAAATRPMDPELRAQIIAVYDRQAKAERQDRLILARMSTWRGRRNAALACAGAVAVLLCAGAGLFAAGWSYGGTARVAELCQGDAVREQGGGKVCAFWISAPTQKGAGSR